jgi:hypothetical protein
MEFEPRCMAWDWCMRRGRATRKRSSFSADGLPSLDFQTCAFRNVHERIARLSNLSPDVEVTLQEFMRDSSTALLRATSLQSLQCPAPCGFAS